MPDVAFDAGAAVESSRARQAFLDYSSLGGGRSLELLVDRYRTQIAPEAPPTRRLETLKRWSARFGWQARLIAEQERANERAAAALADRRRRAMETGLALDFERVLALKEMADMLELRILEAATPADAEIPTDLIREWRGVLDDIAKETNGRQRIQRVDLRPELRQLAQEYGEPEDDVIEIGMKYLERFENADRRSLPVPREPLTAD